MIILISERDMPEKVSLWNHDCYANIDLTRYVSKGLVLRGAAVSVATKPSETIQIGLGKKN